MFPLLPALILLLLGGSSSAERLAASGELPLALRAIQRQIESQSGDTAKARAAERALASLLALSGHPQVSRALVRILSADLSAAEAPAAAAAPKRVASAPPPPCPRSIGQSEPGFLSAQRSRDGPSAR